MGSEMCIRDRVGINLLREGLDMPEVSLVAILDADKEGFLRSDRSLIQTIGRAARNLNGRAILYADRVTDSMKRAIEETERRREKQEQHNIENGITPKSISKKVLDIMEAGSPVPGLRKKGNAQEEDTRAFAALSPSAASKKIRAMEKEMYQFAKELEFEKAAALRDQIEVLRSVTLGPNLV